VIQIEIVTMAIPRPMSITYLLYSKSIVW